MENTFQNLKMICEVDEIVVENLMTWKVLAPTRQCKYIERYNTREPCAMVLRNEEGNNRWY